MAQTSIGKIRETLQAAVLGLQHLLAMYSINPGANHDCWSLGVFSS